MQRAKLKASLVEGTDFTTWAAEPIKYSVATSSSTIVNSRRILPLDKSIGYTYVRGVERSKIDDYVQGLAVDYGTNGSTFDGAVICAAEFVFSGTAFEFLLYGGGSHFIDGNIFIEVDGRLTNADGYAPPSFNDAKQHYVRIKFDAAVSNKHIKILFPGGRAFGGLVVEADALVTAYTPANDCRVVIIGDSYTEGAGAHHKLADFYACRLGKAMGWYNTIISGLGGTGYYNPAGVHKTYGERVNDVIAANPDAVIITGGINDVGETSAGDEGWDAYRYYRDIRLALPNTEIFVAGPFYPQDVHYPNAYRDEIKRAAAAIPRTHFIDATNWFTGDGNEEAPAHNGNADMYIGPDGVHPNTAGHKYLAAKLAAELKVIIYGF